MGWLRRGLDLYLAGQFRRSANCYLHAGEIGQSLIHISNKSLVCHILFNQLYSILILCSYCSLLWLTSSLFITIELFLPGYEVSVSNAAYVLKNKIPRLNNPNPNPNPISKVNSEKRLATNGIDTGCYGSKYFVLSFEPCFSFLSPIVLPQVSNLSKKN